MTATLFRAVLLASLVLLPAMTLIGSPAATVLLCIDAAAALAVIALTPAARRPENRPDRLVLAAMLALPAIGLVSAAWSLMPGESALRALKLLGLVGGGLAVFVAARGPARPDPRHALAAILLGLAIAAGLAMTDRFLLFEVLDDLEPGFQPRHGFYSRGATVMLLFAVLTTIGLDRRGQRWIAAAIYLGIGALVAVKFRSGAAAMVWSLGGAVYLAWCATQGCWRQGFALLLAGFCLVAPVVVLAVPAPDPIHAANRALPGSWSHRIVIWQFAAKRIAERPVLGWGLDASRKIPGGRETIAWQMDPDPRDPGDRMSVVQVMPLHPHSLALQVWLELGAIGALALAALAWLLVTRAGAGGAGSVALVYAGMAISNVSYGAWQTWWLATLMLVAAAAASVSAPKDR
ncbi:MAG: O-antigen ligase family protein [Alphaproteobacteria bacterium]|nr:O-antigen ligase family protein [Alphaproteobacteria bacterium]